MLSGLKCSASGRRGGSDWGAGEHEGVESGNWRRHCGRSGFFVFRVFFFFWEGEVSGSVEVSVQRAENGGLRGLRVWNLNTERFFGG